MRRIGISCLLATLALGVAPMAAEASGNAYFNHTVNWQNTGNLYFSVAGGPPNTCGDLWSLRNGGSWTQGAGWICTDANGNATKGPWTWAGQANDEIGRFYIGWPGGTKTNEALHIWDKTCPTINITAPNSNPPTYFKGSASDATWGAGFNYQPTCQSVFRNINTGLYWHPSTLAYTQSAATWQNCSTSSNTQYLMNWQATQVPASNLHLPGNCYRWTVCVTDGPLAQACLKCSHQEFCM